MNQLAKPLRDLLCSEGSDAVEAETEKQAVLIADADIELIELDGQCAAIVGVAERVEGRDQRREARLAAVLKIKEDRSTPIEPFVPISEKDRGTPL